jgi:hypothetical protein
MFLKYTGDSDVRTISKTEFKNVDEGYDHPDVRWDASNRHIVEVSDEVGQMLIQKSKDQFREATDKELVAELEAEEEET